MVQGVTVIHLGRCGSTVLGNLLSQHTQITWFGEILEPTMQAARKAQGDNYFIEGDPARLARKTLEGCATVYGGVEFKPYHFDAFRMSQMACISNLRRFGFQKFVVLDRRNRLRKIVSSRLAASTGVWHVRAETKRQQQRLTLQIENLHMDHFTGSLVQFLDMYEAQFTKLRECLSPDYLDLLYEDDIETDPTVAYRKVVESLGLNAEPVNVKLGRTSSGSLRDELENFEAVAQHLAGTRYAWMLDS